MQYVASCPLCGAIVIVRYSQPKDKHCPCCNHHISYYQEVEIKDVV